MANKPVVGVSTCPYCEFKNLVVWAGNFKFTCYRCRRKYQVKRQKIKVIESAILGIDLAHDA